MMTNQDSQPSLIELIRAEEFTENEFLQCFSETPRERDIIEKLKGHGAHLLEGPRGVGKSSLMRKAEIELDEEFQRTRSISDSRFKLLIDNYQDLETCPNQHPRQVDGPFCPICGARFEVDRVIEKLLEDPLDNLGVTPFLKRKLKDEFIAVKLAIVVRASK